MTQDIAFNEDKFLKNGFIKLKTYRNVWNAFAVQYKNGSVFDETRLNAIKETEAIVRYVRIEEIAQIYAKTYLKLNEELFTEKTLVSKKIYNGVPLPENRDFYDGIENAVIQGGLGCKKTYAVLVLKHGVTTNLGLNGQDHEDFLIVDIEDVNNAF